MAAHRSRTLTRVVRLVLPVVVCGDAVLGVTVDERFLLGLVAVAAAVLVDMLLCGVRYLLVSRILTRLGPTASRRHVRDVIRFVLRG